MCSGTFPPRTHCFIACKSLPLQLVAVWYFYLRMKISELPPPPRNRLTCFFHMQIKWNILGNLLTCFYKIPMSLISLEFTTLLIYIYVCLFTDIRYTHTYYNNMNGFPIFPCFCYSVKTTLVSVLFLMFISISQTGIYNTCGIFVLCILPAIIS